MDHKHLTYSGFATIAVAVSLLLAAPAHAVQLPDGQNTLADTARAAGETLTATGGHTPSGGGDSAVSGAIDQGRAVQQTLSGQPAAAAGGQQNEPAPPSSGVAVERPGAQGDVEKAVAGVLKSGDAVKDELASAGKDAGDAVKQVETAAGELLTSIPLVGPAVQHADGGRSKGSRTRSTGIAAPSAAAAAARASASSSASSATSHSQTSALAKRRFRAGEPAARSSSLTAAPRVETVRPAYTGPGGGATASTGLGFAAAAILLAAWLLAGTGLRTRLLSSPATSPALGFTSLLERPG